MVFYSLTICGSHAALDPGLQSPTLSVFLQEDFEATGYARAALGQSTAQVRLARHLLSSSCQPPHTRRSRRQHQARKHELVAPTKFLSVVHSGVEAWNRHIYESSTFNAGCPRGQSTKTLSGPDLGR